MKWNSDQLHFLLKGGGILLLLLATGIWFNSRFFIGIDPQEQACLPWTFYIVDTKQTDIQKGQFFAYEARGMEPVVADGQVALKQAAGTYGSVVEITADGTRVDGMPRFNGAITLLEHLDEPPQMSEIERSFTVPKGEIFAMGTEPVSYDSRYWGNVSSSQIKGRAIPLF